MKDWFLELVKNLRGLDEQLFLLSNQSWTHPWADQFFLFLTNMHNTPWGKWGVIPAILFLWFYFKGRQMFRVVLVLAIVVGLTDMLGYRVLKGHFDRTRPNNSTHIHSELRLPHSPQCGSFPSNHALNSFAGATVLTWYYPHLWPVYFGIAALSGYSRLYVGVHYPSDVLAGALLGLLIILILQSLVLRHISWLQPEMRRRSALPSQSQPVGGGENQRQDQRSLARRFDLRRH